MKKVFICSPYRGDIEKNTELAKHIGRLAAVCEYVPVIPHMLFPQFLHDSDPKERIMELCMGAELLKCCDSLWIIGNTITKGMHFVIDKAKEWNIPIRLYDAKGERIYGETILIDDRVSEELTEILRGAHLE